jgi:hypothetical protein
MSRSSWGIRLFLLLTPALCACAALFSYTRGSDSIIVPHSTHSRAKVGCLTCHEEIYDAKTLGPSYRPKEAKCLECHREKKTTNQCAFCHTEVGRRSLSPAGADDLHVARRPH